MSLISGIVLPPLKNSICKAGKACAQKNTARLESQDALFDDKSAANRHKPVPHSPYPLLIHQMVEISKVGGVQNYEVRPVDLPQGSEDKDTAADKCRQKYAS